MCSEEIDKKLQEALTGLPLNVEFVRQVLDSLVYFADQNNGNILCTAAVLNSKKIITLSGCGDHSIIVLKAAIDSSSKVEIPFTCATLLTPFIRIQVSRFEHSLVIFKSFENNTIKI